MNGRRLLVPPFAVLLAALTSLAQPPREPKDGKITVPLTANPAAAPVPALKYFLLPEVRDQQPGNQIPAFYKCFMEQHHFYRAKESIDQREAWLVAPLADLAKMNDTKYGGTGLRQADWAARLETVDWQILLLLRRDGINTLLPDVQQLRELAAALKVRMRLEVAHNDFPAAIRTAQTLFALARSFESHPTLIGSLVGIAITAMTLDAVEELIAQPGAPNLFWAIGALPNPMFTLRTPSHGERSFADGDFGRLGKSDPISDADLMQLAKLVGIYVDAPKKERDVPLKAFQAAATDQAKVKAARARLVEHGHAAVAVEKVSPLQAIMMDDFAQYEIYRDELLKWFGVPFWKIPADAEGKLPKDAIFPAFAPAGMKVLLAQVRIQQRIALIQTVEAVRMHAAANGGKVPTALTDLKLPVPADPVTGRDFVYEVKDGVAIIRATPPASRKDDPHFNRVYEVTIRK